MQKWLERNRVKNTAMTVDGQLARAFEMNPDTTFKIPNSINGRFFFHKGSF
jgi:glucose-6-phosphate isomerase